LASGEDQSILKDQTGRRAQLASAARRVLLEDGLGLQVVIAHPAIDSREAERILIGHAAALVDSDLTDEPLPGGSG
jgi:hypothetical protein